MKKKRRISESKHAATMENECEYVVVEKRFLDGILAEIRELKELLLRGSSTGWRVRDGQPE